MYHDTGYVLGLDIGTNSIGWAAVDEIGSQVLGMGVRVFPEGVDRDQTGAEHPKNEQRRIARGHRRQIARRARRKAAMRRALVEVGWLLADDQQWNELISIDPYELRSRGLDQQLTLSEFGRVLIHLAQRRGFLSNRKADRGRRKENSVTLQEISALADDIHRFGCRTLGEYFYRQLQNSGEFTAIRVRDRHTRRQMFEEEFELLWETQKGFQPDVYTDALKYGEAGKQSYPRDPWPLKRGLGKTILQEFGFHGILFFQRSLYWPKSVIGQCELEAREKRCERADRLAQRFRLLNEVNNLRIIPLRGDPRSLTSDERTSLIAFLSRRSEATFDQIRKELRLLEGDGFNLEAGNRRKLDGAPIDMTLSHKSLFGRTWHDRPEAERNAIVRSLLDDEAEVIVSRATNEWGCEKGVAEALAEIDLTAIARGYAAYSRTALSKLLPHMETGLLLMTRDGTPSALSLAGYLRPDQRNVGRLNQMPLPSDRITNPLVKQALFEVRKIVNATLREWGLPQAIHIELAREVQGSVEKRRQLAFEMREREQRRDDAAIAIREQGFKATRESIERFLLWQEQKEMCLYSGRMISPIQLHGGEVEIDHILPYSQSLDNSLMNKALCFRTENRDKGQRTIWQWLGEANLPKFESILQRARNLPYEVRNRKLIKLQQKVVVLDQFLNRQLNDTAYITTQVLDSLRCLGCELVASKGQVTADLRRMWGLNAVLRDDGLDLKSRDDHRHHAIDALVIALTNRSRLQQLARVRFTDEQLPAPWTNIRETVASLVSRIKVSHRAVRDLNGALHEETIYGPTSKPHRGSGQPRPHAQQWIEADGVYVVRKKLEELTAAMIDSIRDPQVREVVSDRLRLHGIEPGGKGKISKEVWKEPLFMVRKNGRLSSNTSIIKKVRLLRRDLTIRPIRGGTACVKPGNTHHIALFELPGHTPERPKREMIAVSMLEATERAGRGEPLVNRTHPCIPQARFLFSLSWGDTVWANIRGREDLYVFRTAASTQGQMYFVAHTDARPSATSARFAVKANTLEGVKVSIDPLGRIRNAND